VSVVGVVKAVRVVVALSGGGDEGGTGERVVFVDCHVCFGLLTRNDMSSSHRQLALDLTSLLTRVRPTLFRCLHDYARSWQDSHALSFRPSGSFRILHANIRWARE
jgi:hypothetical protein